MSIIAAGRLFASHYQIVICDDPSRSVSDEENWDESKVARGFAGGVSFRMVGTEADLNDHWVELDLATEPPKAKEWQRITCVHLRSESGKIHVMSVVDDEPVLSADIGIGDYSVFVAAQNLGIDQLSLGEEAELSDRDIASRTDLERYRIFLVRGLPRREGRLKDAQA